MAKVNTYGMRMHGLRSACSETRFLATYPRSGAYVQIDYDKTTGRIYANFFVDQNSWISREGDVITVLRATTPKTMQQIADAIRDYPWHL